MANAASPSIAIFTGETTSTTARVVTEEQAEQAVLDDETGAQAPPEEVPDGTVAEAEDLAEEEATAGE